MSVTALTALIVAVTGFVTAVAALIALFRRQGQVAAQVGEVHKLVNNQLDRQLVYNQRLAAALTAAGAPVPEQDKPPGTGEAGERMATPGNGVV
jgi:hypothetical protein